MRVGILGVLLVAFGCASWSTAQAQARLCDKPRQMDGFKTCADVEKAEAEGEVVLYSTDPEQGQVKLLAAFRQLFPKIKTSYVRLQAGALYAKLLSERQAKSYLVDVMQISDMGMVLDFQRRGGYRQYVSPEMAAFKKAYKSEPEGFWTWGAIIMAGIAYNPNNVPAAEAPKTWEDLLDPKWTDAVNVKVSNSGLQHGVWYTLRPLLGADYFKKFAAIKPRAFDSYVQQYGRLIDGQDKIIMGAQYSGYIEFKAKGAPLAFVFPQTGVPTVPQTWGIIKDGPHPNAAELLMDWFLSPVGQKAYADALLLHSPREDVPPPGNGLSLKEMKLLVPDDWNAFEKDRPQFAKEWDRIVGARR
ncbi:ABC transporter substrate-binding protein [Vineibacter terrae]|uniref:ABC transporter substrate-binding protein n=1 Tax=Vineibacter terrae TaxID=2586908 RepID=UPI002E321F42|nr:extracellular solute-binding protein [Vineibacter terrae]HEX2885989.1 extracellular solute-binding protein [Vineibacter terrae]